MSDTKQFHGPSTGTLEDPQLGTKMLQAQLAEVTAQRDEMLAALKLMQRLMTNLMGKGNIDWGNTFGIDFGLMNQALIKMDRAVEKADK